MNEGIWEKEYLKPRLVTGGTEAIQSVKDWVRFLRREKGIELSNLKILDLGCGNGKNSIYIAEQGDGNEIFGLDISKTAVEIAQKQAQEKNVSAQFTYGNIGNPLPFSDSYFDIALDVTSSNSLNDKEREIYLKETHRVLKPSGHFFVRALCKDGDSNAKNLLKTNPGKETDTYVMPDLGLTERVFSKEDFVEMYSKYFAITKMEKEVHYTKFNNRSYKRHFWVVWMEKNGVK
jgi:ubiquinone/menaquinone biosynthesis C-methylase UbiE